MRILKLCTVLTAALAICGTAQAITIINGPLAFDISDFSQGTLYDPEVWDGVAYKVVWDGSKFYNPATTAYDLDFSPRYDADDVKQFSGPTGGEGTEDGWSIFRVNFIEVASIAGNTVTGVGPTVWSDGNGGRSLMGTIFNRVDLTVEFERGAAGPTGAQNIEATGDDYVLWDQPFDLTGLTGAALVGWNSIAAQGSGGRIAGTDKFIGIGYTTAGTVIASASEYLIGESVAGFVGVDKTTTEVYVQSFSPATRIGTTDAFLEVTGGYADFVFDTGVFIAPEAGFPNADFALQANTSQTIVGDWLVASRDPLGGFAVPEPVTLLSVMFAAGGLGSYLRRRRRLA